MNLIKGQLGRLGVPDLFRAIAAESRSGRLSLTNDESEPRSVVIHFRGGRIYELHAEPTVTRLARRLVSAGVASSEELEEARTRTHGDRSYELGEVVVGDGLLRRSQLEAIVKEQVADAIFEAMRWGAGEFVFEPEIVSDNDLGIELDVEEALAESKRRLEEWRQIARRVQSLNAAPYFDSADHAPPEVALTPDEWSFVSRVDGALTINQLIDACGFTALEGARCAFGLATSGLIAVPLNLKDADSLEEMAFAGPTVDAAMAEKSLIDLVVATGGTVEGLEQELVPEDQPVAEFADEPAAGVWTEEPTAEIEAEELVDELPGEEPLEVEVDLVEVELTPFADQAPEPVVEHELARLGPVTESEPEWIPEPEPALTTAFTDEIAFDVEPEIEAVVEYQTEAVVEPEMEAEAVVEYQTEAVVEYQTEAVVEPEPEAEIEAEAESVFEPPSEPDPEPEPEPVLAEEDESEPVLELETEVEAELRPTDPPPAPVATPSKPASVTRVTMPDLSEKGVYLEPASALFPSLWKGADGDDFPEPPDEPDEPDELDERVAAAQSEAERRLDDVTLVPTPLVLAEETPNGRTVVESMTSVFADLARPFDEDVDVVALNDLETPRRIGARRPQEMPSYLGPRSVDPSVDTTALVREFSTYGNDDLLGDQAPEGTQDQMDKASPPTRTGRESKKSGLFGRRRRA